MSLEDQVLAHLHGASDHRVAVGSATPEWSGTGQGPAAIEAIDLQKHYPGVHALKGVDFRLA
eukprot:gene40858-55218_t